jgi:hypothetical protein
VKPILGEPTATPRMPSGAAIQKADLAMSRTALGLCPDCAREVNEDGVCLACNPLLDRDAAIDAEDEARLDQEQNEFEHGGEG